MRFNGTVDFPSIYRINGGSPEAPDYHGPPPPELDTAWARISDDGVALDFIPLSCWLLFTSMNSQCPQSGLRLMTYVKLEK
jgi:hypothetical protein